MVIKRDIERLDRHIAIESEEIVLLVEYVSCCYDLIGKLKYCKLHQ